MSGETCWAGGQCFDTAKDFREEAKSRSPNGAGVVVRGRWLVALPRLRIKRRSAQPPCREPSRDVIRQITPPGVDCLQATRAYKRARSIAKLAFPS
jgi:hypothetical protein